MSNPADVSPTDANTVITPAVDPSAPPGGPYPKMMYHPTLPNQFVISQAAEAALVASDGRWSSTDSFSTM